MSQPVISPEVPIMCLTATAAPRVVDELLQMLGDSALVEKSSVNRPNIALSVRQLKQDEMLDGKS